MKLVEIEMPCILPPGAGIVDLKRKFAHWATTIPKRRCAIFRPYQPKTSESESRPASNTARGDAVETAREAGKILRGGGHHAVGIAAGGVVPL